MPQFSITENGSTDWFNVLHNDGVHIGLHGNFGGGTVAVEQRINGTAYPVLNEDVAIEMTGDSDAEYGIKRGDAIRLTTTGSTTPSIDATISNNPDSYETQIANKNFGYYVE